MPAFTINEGSPVHVELVPLPGEQESTLSPEELAERSQKALDNAMNTIHHMARRIVNMKDSLDDFEQPTTIEIAFGLKLHTDANAMISRTEDDAALKITLTWEQNEYEEEEETEDY
jgi:hypothetical protein